MDYAIIVPAYNEEALLPGTLCALREAMAAQPFKGELIVVDNNSSDRTAEVAAAAGARVAFEPINQISRARNRGAAASSSRWLVFVDADTLVSQQLLRTALDNLSAGTSSGGALLDFDTYPEKWMRLTTAGWNLISRRLGLAAGSFLYCTREVFDAVGGFSEKYFASEEIWFCLSANRWARKHSLRPRIITEHKAVTSSRKAAWVKGGKLRSIGMLFFIIFWPIAARFRSLCSFWYSRRESK